MTLESELRLTEVEFPRKLLYYDRGEPHYQEDYVNLKFTSISPYYNKVDLKIDMVAVPLGFDINKPVKVKIKITNE